MGGHDGRNGRRAGCVSDGGCMTFPIPSHSTESRRDEKRVRMQRLASAFVRSLRAEEVTVQNGAVRTVSHTGGRSALCSASPDHPPPSPKYPSLPLAGRGEIGRCVTSRSLPPTETPIRRTRNGIDISETVGCQSHGVAFS